MPSRMENFDFFLTRIFVSIGAKRKSWLYVPGTYFIMGPTALVAAITM